MKTIDPEHQLGGDAERAHRRDARDIGVRRAKAGAPMDPEIDGSATPEPALDEQHERERGVEIAVGGRRQNEKARANDDRRRGKKVGTRTRHELDENVVKLRARALRRGAQRPTSRWRTSSNAKKAHKGDRDRDRPLTHRVVVEDAIEELIGAHDVGVRGASSGVTTAASKATLDSPRGLHPDDLLLVRTTPARTSRHRRRNCVHSQSGSTSSPK